MGSDERRARDVASLVFEILCLPALLRLVTSSTQLPGAHLVQLPPDASLGAPKPLEEAFDHAFERGAGGLWVQLVHQDRPEDDAPTPAGLPKSAGCHLGARHAPLDVVGQGFS